MVNWLAFLLDAARPTYIVSGRLIVMVRVRAQFTPSLLVNVLNVSPTRRNRTHTSANVKLPATVCVVPPLVDERYCDAYCVGVMSEPTEAATARQATPRHQPSFGGRVRLRELGDARADVEVAGDCLVDEPEAVGRPGDAQRSAGGDVVVDARRQCGSRPTG